MSSVAVLERPVAVFEGEPSQPTARIRSRRRVPGELLAALAVALVVTVVPWVLQLDPTRLDLLATNQLPSLQHLLGTDESGRDVLARLLSGGRVSLGVAGAATLVATAWGALYGAASGLARPWLDACLMRVVDALLAFPNIMLVLLFAALVPAGIPQLVLLLALSGWMHIARLVRGVTRDLRNAGFLEAATASGARPWRVMSRHLLPNMTGVIGVAATLELTKAIIGETTVSFLGVGIRPPTPSWGNMLTRAQDYLFTAPWLALAPGLAISLTVFIMFRLQERIRQISR